MKVETFKKLIKEAVKEAVKEVLNENTKPTYSPNNVKGRLDEMFGEKPKTLPLLKETQETPNPEGINNFWELMEETANNLTTQDISGMKNLS